MSIQQPKRYGRIALLGAPNAGKSTLLNALIGEKISIVTPKAQTTRTIITGLLTQDQTQLIFLDTPGIFEPKRTLEKAIVKRAMQTLHQTDMIALVVDAHRGHHEHMLKIMQTLKKHQLQAVLVLNKIDLISKAELLPLTQTYAESGLFTDSFMISAKKHDGVDHLLKYFLAHAKLGDWHYDQDELSNMPMRFLACEYTREKLFLALNKELPYSISVATESWEQHNDGSILIHQVIYVLTDGQKGIVIGKGGHMLKRVGTQARKELEELLGTRVHLKLHVKIKPNWIDRPDHYIDATM